jgi:hypothetical protein
MSRPTVGGRRGKSRGKWREASYELPSERVGRVITNFRQVWLLKQADYIKKLPDIALSEAMTRALRSHEAEMAVAMGDPTPEQAALIEDRRKRDAEFDAARCKCDCCDHGEYDE